MRKWKDDGSHVVKPLHRKLYFIIGILIITRPVIGIVITKSMEIMDLVNILLGVLLIWGVNFNGFYKIAKLYAEWNLRRKDNRFDYYSK